ncbi:MAG: gliding motility-associated C-terminal domain-containing protein [Phaeodactylibacter sp.]|nr:gliding motility-associated C-terminal domain-containing protein [Phaeodactylibacter sp.]MCB9299979.1 gliding motility-associated C-terminal domain-containing protein [Lewinellaceae bacterium]
MQLLRLMASILLILAPAWISAQATFGKWFSAPSGNNIRFAAIAPTPDGGWLAAGQEQEPGFAFFSRFQPDGSLSWSRQVSQSRLVRDLLGFPDGTFLVLNNNQSFNDYFDASMLHLAADGSVLGEKVWGTPEGQDEWYAGTVLASGDALCVGIQRDYSVFPLFDGLSLAKVSPDFNVLWSRTWKAPGLMSPTGVAAVAGGFFVAAELSENFDPSLALLRFDDDGNLLWARSFDWNGGLQGAAGVVGLPDGGALMCGYHLGDPANAGLVFRVDASGELVWAKALTDGGENSAARLYLKDDNTAILTGLNSGQVFPPVDNNIVVNQLSISDGSILSTLAFGTEEADLAVKGFWDGNLLTLAGGSLSGVSNELSKAYLARTRLESSCCERDFAFQVVDITSEVQARSPAWEAATTLFPQDNPASATSFQLNAETFCNSAGEGANTAIDICLGEPVSLTTDTIPGTAYNWSNGATTPGITVDAAGVYFVALTDECGTRTDTFEVTAVGNAVLAVVNPVEPSLCAGESIQLQASGGASYSWLPADGLSSTDVSNPLASPEVTTDYQVAVSDGACADTVLVRVAVNPIPLVQAGTDTLLLKPVPVRLSASGGATYLWSPAQGLDCVDCPNPLALPEVTTLYTVTAFDANGCSATDDVLVEVDLGRCAVYIPNAFSPNDDGRNDAFQAFARPDQFSMRIFDRWGAQVFQSEDITRSWDGLFLGKAAPAGVYVYLIEMNICGQPSVYSGDVLLVR